MSPRQYSMTRRRRATDDTRARILEATLALHGERGIFGTSWRDIAEAADVALGTVYRHFPSLDELVPACGELLMASIYPPSAADAHELFSGATTTEERLLRTARHLFAFYARGGTHLESDLRERRLPAVQEWEAYLRATVSALLAAALEPRALAASQLAFASSLLDLPVYNAFRSRGIDTDDAAAAVANLLGLYLGTTMED
jgi:AcrR family transcriptional regulator